MMTERARSDAEFMQLVREALRQELRHVDTILTPTQVAELLDCSGKTLDKYVHDGLPSHRLSDRVVRFRKSEVLDWISRKESA